MKNWIKKRSAEPTTYIGVALLINGFGTLFKMDGADAVAGAVQSAAGALSTGDYTTAAVTVLGGLAAVLMGEKGRK